MAYPVVRKIADGDSAEEGEFNAPINDLEARTDHLLSLVQALTVDQAIQIEEALIQAGTLPGTPVYYDTSDKVFKPALASLDPDAGYNNAAAKSLWRGMVRSITGTSGTVVLGGSFALDTVAWAAVMKDGVFAAGRYFLDSTTDGLLNTDSGALGIYICDIDADGRAYLAGQGTTNFLNHIHRKVVLRGDPADDAPQADPGSPNPQLIITPNAALRGWLPAGNQGELDSYFAGFTYGSEVPSGTVFGYNIQQADETYLRSVFPPIPEGSAEVQIDGVAGSDTTIIINAYGIWWQDNSYGNAPWDVDYSVTSGTKLIEYWTTRIPVNTSFYDLVYQDVLAQLIADFATIGIRSLSVDSPNGYLVITNDGDGNALISNDGVWQLIPGAGLSATSIQSAGNVVDGFRKQVRLENTVEIPLIHLPQKSESEVGESVYRETLVGDNVQVTWNIVHNLGEAYPQVTVWDKNTGSLLVPSIVSNTANDLTITLGAAPGLGEEVDVAVRRYQVDRPQTELITTNGSEAGTALTLYGYPIGPTAADYQDFFLYAGQWLPAGVNYQPTLRILGTVDDPDLVTPVAGNFDVQIFLVDLDGSIADETTNTWTYTRQMVSGAPARLQSAAVVVPTADMVLTRDTGLIVRIKPNTGGSPLPVGTQRILGITASVARV